MIVSEKATRLIVGVFKSRTALLKMEVKRCYCLHFGVIYCKEIFHISSIYTLMHSFNRMINRRENNILNILSYIVNVSEAIFHHQLFHVYDIIVSPIYHNIKADKQLQLIYSVKDAC